LLQEGASRSSVAVCQLVLGQGESTDEAADCRQQPVDVFVVIAVDSGHEKRSEDLERLKLIL
jgi:hypothetical protein